MRTLFGPHDQAAAGRGGVQLAGAVGDPAFGESGAAAEVEGDLAFVEGDALEVKELRD
jgi:hypothetical protein